MLLVTGGSDYEVLDSTEILRPRSGWQVITSAKLPRPMEGMRVTTVGNRVLLSGTSLTVTRVTGGFDSYHSSDILEYTHGDGWSKIGKLRVARYNHATSLIDFTDFERYCN